MEQNNEIAKYSTCIERVKKWNNQLE